LQDQIYDGAVQIVAVSTHPVIATLDDPLYRFAAKGTFEKYQK
jgi:hypothetical protein